MNSTFKIDWAKLASSKTIKALVTLAVSLLGMVFLKLTESEAAMQAAQWVDYAWTALMLLSGGSFMAAAHGRIYADGPLTKTVEQVQADKEIAAAKAVTKHAKKLANAKKINK